MDIAYKFLKTTLVMSLTLVATIMSASAQDSANGQQAAPEATKEEKPKTEEAAKDVPAREATSTEKAKEEKPTTEEKAKEGTKPEAAKEEKPENKETAKNEPAEDKAKTTTSANKGSAAQKPLTKKQQQSRIRIERIKAEARKKAEKAKADPNYAKKLDELKQRAYIQHLERLLKNANLKLRQSQIERLGGKLKTQPPKDLKPTAAAGTAAPSATKTSLVKNKAVFQLLSDETETPSADDEATAAILYPLAVLDQAKTEMDAARTKLEESQDSEISDEDLSALLEEELRASSIYMQVLKESKQIYTQLQDVAKDDPTLSEFFTNLITAIDESIAEEEAIGGTESEEPAAPETEKAG